MALKMWLCMHFCGQIVDSSDDVKLKFMNYFYVQSHRQKLLISRSWIALSINWINLIFSCSTLHQAMSIGRSPACRLFKRCFTSSKAVVEEWNSWYSGMCGFQIQFSTLLLYRYWLHPSIKTCLPKNHKKILSRFPR